MKNNKAIILLSTYNGEKYLEELLKSIIKQTYKNYQLIIRDDGSTDKTKDILKKYEKKYNNIKIINDDKNLGYPECFYELTDKAPKASYYFFADQDDVWYSTKLEKAITELNKYSSNEILAYYAGYNICDSNLNIVGQSKRKNDNIYFYNTLFDVCSLEFTMAINYKALDFLNKNKPINARARGTWMSMLFSAFGRIIYDKNPCALYRRHETSVTSSKMSGIGLWIWRIKKFFGNDQFSEYKNILKDFNDVVGDKLNKNNKKIINIFLGKNRLKKIFFPKRLRSSLIDDIALRIVFLLGKL